MPPGATGATLRVRVQILSQKLPIGYTFHLQLLSRNQYFGKNQGGPPPLNDLVIFHKIFYKINDYCVELPSYLRPYEEDERRRLRTTINAPSYLGDCETSTMDLSVMREMSYDSKSLKCTIVPKCSQFRSSYFFRSHLLWNYIPLDIRSEMCPSRFKKLLLVHLWDVILRPD